MAADVSSLEGDGVLEGLARGADKLDRWLQDAPEAVHRQALITDGDLIVIAIALKPNDGRTS